MLPATSVPLVPPVKLVITMLSPRSLVSSRVPSALARAVTPVLPASLLTASATAERSFQSVMLAEIATLSSTLASLEPYRLKLRVSALVVVHQ